MTNPRRIRAFTIPEILVVVTLVSILAFSLLINVRSSGDRIRSEGLAAALTEELRAARAMAAQEQTEVMVAFPATAGGGVCRSFRIFQGEDLLKPVRIQNFDDEYESSIFFGEWPSELEWQSESTIDEGRLAALGDYNVILFRPDGSVQTNLPRQGGAVCLVVANALRFSAGEQFSGRLEAVDNPNTVVIQRSGSITLEKGLHRASGELARTDERPPLVALRANPPSNPSNPIIERVDFSPKSGTEGGEVGMGKTFIEIHPISGEERHKEYGMATLTVESSAPSGGPLFMEVSCRASDGNPGTFASHEPVRMEFFQDRWIGSVGWRPPAEASPEVSYEFEVVVSDYSGRSVSASSDASVVPALKTLTNYRLAVETPGKEIYLANLDGGELVRVSPPGSREEKPVWSGDGTKVFVLSYDGSLYSFVRYNADGTEREVVSTFPAGSSGFELDPWGIYLTYMHSESTQEYETRNHEGNPSNTTATTYNLSALHVANGGNHRSIASAAGSGVLWMAGFPGVFQYTTVSPSLVTEEVPALDEDGIPIEGEFVEESYYQIHYSTHYGRLTGLNPDVGTASGFESGNLIGAAFNPYDPRFYARWVRGSHGQPDRLALFRYALSADDVEEVAVLKGHISLTEKPTWSANGQWISYMVRNGDNPPKLNVQKVLLPSEDGPMDAPAEVEEAIELNTSGTVTLPRLTPNGETLLYLSGNPGTPDSKLMRVDVEGSRQAEEIGSELEGISSYAITQ